jgi:hypothetical protein
MILPAHLVAAMQNVSVMNSHSSYHYGLGLMHGNVAPRKQSKKHPSPPPPVLGEYGGHAGTTYGFLSFTAFFPALNASISVAVNQDYTAANHVRHAAMCRAVEVAAHHKGLGQVDLGCM